MKGKIAAKKKEEISAAMKQAVALVQSYVPPDPQRIQAAKAAGNLAMVPTGPNSMRLDLRNYVKSGDTFSLGLDTAGFAMQTVSVKSYLESEKDAVTLDVTFARLRDGLSYPGNVVLNVPGENIQVVVQNSNYQRVAPAAATTAKPAAAQKPAAGAAKPAAAPTKPSASDAALDTLTGPIALYPDALVAQILEASKDVAAVQKFAGWLKTNSALKGTELQDAAQKAGFAAPYIALAPFPQVVQMMVEKPDWTRQLGAAFTSDEQAVYQSIQRLRAAAMALGNLKTTPQQEVVTDTSSTGQPIILVQPANPQVVYVPVYNTQTVYVQQAPPPSSPHPPMPPPRRWSASRWASSSGPRRTTTTTGRTRGTAAERRTTTRMSGGRTTSTTARTSMTIARTSARTPTKTVRTTARTMPRRTRRSGSQPRSRTSRTRQTAASSPRRRKRKPTQANRQSTAQSNQSSRQSTASTSGYQSGGAAKAQSARGSSSRASSRSGGGSRRR